MRALSTRPVKYSSMGRPADVVSFVDPDFMPMYTVQFVDVIVVHMVALRTAALRTRVTTFVSVPQDGVLT